MVWCMVWWCHVSSGNSACDLSSWTCVSSCWIMWPYHVNDVMWHGSYVMYYDPRVRCDVIAVCVGYQCLQLRLHCTHIQIQIHLFIITSHIKATSRSFQANSLLLPVIPSGPVFLSTCPRRPAFVPNASHPKQLWSPPLHSSSSSCPLLAA